MVYRISKWNEKLHWKSNIFTPLISSALLNKDEEGVNKARESPANTWTSPSEHMCAFCLLHGLQWKETFNVLIYPWRMLNFLIKLLTLPNTKKRVVLGRQGEMEEEEDIPLQHSYLYLWFNGNTFNSSEVLFFSSASPDQQLLVLVLERTWIGRNNNTHNKIPATPKL